MRDIVILSGIVIFWFILSISFSSIANDTYLTQTIITGNQSYIIESDNSINLSLSADDNPSITNPISFFNMFIRIFTFRIPGITGIPDWLGTTISFFNWFLFGIFGITIYRLIRHGGG